MLIIDLNCCAHSFCLVFAVIKGAVSRNSAKLGNDKMSVKNKMLKILKEG